MLIQSLNIGLPKKEVFNYREYMTGICKKPAAGPVRLTVQGFEGDGAGDRKHHGGKDKAVCVYSLDHYAYWETMLSISMPAAAFGENLSARNAREDHIHIGDIFRLGSATVQVSQPRQPCRTLAARYGREDLVKMVVDSGFTGFYLRVIEEGSVRAGDRLDLLARDALGVSVSYANNILHHERKNREGIERVLSVRALSESWQKSFREMLSALC